MNNLFTKKEVYQFKVAFVSYLKLKQNRALKEKIDKCLSHHFDRKTPAITRTTFKQDSTRVIYFIM